MADENTPDGGDDRAGGDPGGLPGGRIPPPPVPRDEWVAQVVDDPSSTVQPVLLRGYVGDAPDEEHTRIYLDASLSCHVDVRNEDVLHHQPLDGDHTPRGGSMVWVRGDAFAGQGTGGAAAGGFFTGPVLEQNRQPGGGAAAALQAAIGTYQVGCPTLGFTCTYVHCPPQPAAGAQAAAGIPTGQYSPACPSFGFTCTYVNCPRTSTCPPTYMPGCGGTGGAEAAAAPQAAIGTYQVGCPTLGFTCTYVHCPTQQVAGAQAAVGHPTLGYTCTYIYCPTQPAVGAQAAAVPSYRPECPTFGFTCTAFC